MPNNLEINWGKGKKFHLVVLTSAECRDTALDEGKPIAGLDTYIAPGKLSRNRAWDSTNRPWEKPGKVLPLRPKR